MKSQVVDPVDKRPGGVPLLMFVLLSAATAFQLNASMLSPVLPIMARDLNTDEATVGLTQTAFFTAGAMCGLFLPRLSDMVGRRKILLIMLSVMSVGGILAALAPNIQLLVAARTLQGISGCTIPMTLIMLRSQVKNEVRLGTLMGIIAAVNGGIAGIDVIVSGWIAENWGFRPVFWLIVLIGFLATAAVFLWAPESKPSAHVKMDWLGAAFLVASVLMMTLASNEAGKAGNANWALVIGLIIGGLIAFTVFWKWEKGRKQPLVAPKYLKRPHTWALLLTTVLTMVGLFAAVNGVAISLAQNPDAGYGMDADAASLLLLTPYALIGWLVGPFAGRAAPRIGYGRLLRIGNGASVVLLLGLAILGVQSKLVLVACVILLGVTYAGITNIVLNNLGVMNSPKDYEGFLPGMTSASFNLGAGISFAVLPVFMVAGSPAGSESTAGYTTAFLVGAGILVLAIVSSLFIPKVRAEDAAYVPAESSAETESSNK